MSRFRVYEQTRNDVFSRKNQRVDDYSERGLVRVLSTVGVVVVGRGDGTCREFFGNDKDYGRTVARSRSGRFCKIVPIRFFPNAMPFESHVSETLRYATFAVVGDRVRIDRPCSFFVSVSLGIRETSAAWIQQDKSLEQEIRSRVHSRLHFSTFVRGDGSMGRFLGQFCLYFRLRVSTVRKERTARTEQDPDFDSIVFMYITDPK